MTKAMNKALDLYPMPEPTHTGKPQTDAEIAARKRAVLLAGSIMSDEWPRMVRAFRTVMERELPSKPTPLPPAEKEHHATLLTSEVHEFSAAGDVIGQADGLFDVIYVALGALCHLGLTDTQILAGFGEVHASNMTKVQDSGKPLINDGLIAPDEPMGKVLKTHNYVRPALAEAMSIEP